jgi:hypothetical protein
MTSPRQAYAAARLHARYANRPSPAHWGALESSRTLDHYVDVLRTAGWLHVPEAAVARDVDALEEWLRETWRATCAEVAAWHPARWRAAYRWAGVLPDLATLAWLRDARAVPAWLARDTHLGPIARAPPEVRAAALAASEYAPLAPAWRERESLLEAWRAQWRATWPRADAPARRGLARFEALLQRAASDALRTRERRERLERALARTWRASAGTAAAGFCQLALRALELERVRGGFASRLVLAAPAPALRVAAAGDAR